MNSTQTPLVESMASKQAVLYLAIELGVQKWHLLSLSAKEG